MVLEEMDPVVRLMYDMGLFYIGEEGRTPLPSGALYGGGTNAVSLIRSSVAGDILAESIVVAANAAGELTNISLANVDVNNYAAARQAWFTNMRMPYYETFFEYRRDKGCLFAQHVAAGLNLIWKNDWECPRQGFYAGSSQVVTRSLLAPFTVVDDRTSLALQPVARQDRGWPLGNTIHGSGLSRLGAVLSWQQWMPRLPADNTIRYGVQCFGADVPEMAKEDEPRSLNLGDPGAGVTTTWWALPQIPANMQDAIDPTSLLYLRARWNVLLYWLIADLATRPPAEIFTANASFVPPVQEKMEYATATLPRLFVALGAVIPAYFTRIGNFYNLHAALTPYVQMYDPLTTRPFHWGRTDLVGRLLQNVATPIPTIYIGTVGRYGAGEFVSLGVRRPLWFSNRLSSLLTGSGDSGKEEAQSPPSESGSTDQAPEEV
jgi:hypothetical protein